MVTLQHIALHSIIKTLQKICSSTTGDKKSHVNSSIETDANFSSCLLIQTLLLALRAEEAEQPRAAACLTAAAQLLAPSGTDRHLTSQVIRSNHDQILVPTGLATLGTCILLPLQRTMKEEQHLPPCLPHTNPRRTGQQDFSKLPPLQKPLIAVVLKLESRAGCGLFWIHSAMLL